MNAQVWRTARWFVAIGVCVIVVLVAVPMAIDALSASLVFGDQAGDAPGEEDPSSVDGGADDTDNAVGPAGEVPTGPVSDGQAAGDHDFVVREGVVAQATSQSLRLRQEGDAVVAVFPLVDGDPACVALAELEMQLEEADATEIAVYASTVRRPLDDGEEVGDAHLDGMARALAVTDGTPGRLRWDVTDLYRAWAAGELAPAGSPLAILVAPPDGGADLTFSSTEAGLPEAPALVWEGETGCGEGG